MVQIVLDKEKANLVLSIPIAPGCLIDMIIWNFTNNELHSMRSGYRLVVRIREIKCGGLLSSSKEVTTRLWHRL